MRSINHGLKLPESFTPIDRASVVIDVDEKLLEIPLTPKQLHAILITLGISFNEETIEMYDDDELVNHVDGVFPGWVGATQAAKLLGVTRGRIYALINAGLLETRDIGGLKISVESINARLMSQPKAGRPPRK